MEKRLSNTAIIIADPSGRVSRSSHALESLIGRPIETLDAVIEAGFDSFIPSGPEEKTRRAGILLAADGTRVEAVLDVERLMPDGQLLWVEIAWQAEGAGDEASGSADQAMSFLARVSHELRTALNGIVGFADMLDDGRLAADQQAHLSKLQSCNEMLKGQIDDVLEYAELKNHGKIDLVYEPVSLEGFVREIAELFADRARERGLQLRVELHSSTRVHAHICRQRLAQVLSNLISNAIKYTEEGSVTLIARCEDDDFCVGVLDTGPGIAESEAHAVFKPFFQLDGAATGGEGTGLGLAISKEWMEKLGGSLTLSHPLAGGSLFELRVPFAAAEESEIDAVEDQAAEAVSAGEASGSGRQRRILVVEDNRLNSDIIGHFLQDYGVPYDHVDDGQKAVDAYEDYRYDLILMDVMMPVMDGYDATRAILKKSKRRLPVPIVGVTAKVFRRDQIRCLEAGMIEVVNKPVDFRQLREVLDRLLRSKVETKDSETLRFANPLARQAVNTERPRGPLDALVLETYITRMQSTGSTREEIMNTAIGIVDAEVEALVESLDEGNRQEISLQAHSLKGALALLGARNILDLAKGLETVASDSQGELRQAHWKMVIEQSYLEFKQELQGYLKSCVH